MTVIPFSSASRAAQLADDAAELRAEEEARRYRERADAKLRGLMTQGVKEFDPNGGQPMIDIPERVTGGFRVNAPGVETPNPYLESGTPDMRGFVPAESDPLWGQYEQDRIRKADPGEVVQWQGGNSTMGAGGPDRPVDPDVEAIVADRLARQKERQAYDLRSTLMQSTATPDQAAADLETARRMGVSRFEVQQDRDNFDIAKRAKEIDQLRDTAPRSFEWLMQAGDNLEVAHDDVQNLSWWDSAGSLIYNAPGALYASGVGFFQSMSGMGSMVSEGADETSRAPSAVWEALIGNSDKAMEIARAQNAANSAVTIPRDPNAPLAQASDSLRSYSDQLYAYKNEVMPKGRNDFESGVYSGIVSIGTQAPWIAAAVITKNPGLATAGMTASTAGEAFSRASAERPDLSYAERAGYALREAGIEFVTEVGPNAIIVNALLKGRVKAAVSGYLASRIPEQLGEQAATHLQDLNEWLSLNPDGTWEQYLAARPSAAMQTFVATLVATEGQMGAGKVAAWAGNQLDQGAQQKRAEDLARFIQALSDNAKDSKLLTRLPDKYREAVAAITKDGPVENIRVQSEAFTELAQTTGVGVEQLAKVFAVDAEQVAASIANGEDVVIPSGNYAAALKTAKKEIGITGEAIHSAFAPNIRLRADDFTAKEQTAMKQVFQAEQEARARAAETDQTFADSADRVREAIREQVVATGMYSTDVANQQAELVGAMVTTLAERTGQDPETLWKEQGFDIVASVSGQRDDGALEQSVARTPNPPSDFDLKWAAEDLEPKQFEAWKGAREGLSNEQIAARMNEVEPDAIYTPQQVSMWLLKARGHGYDSEKAATRVKAPETERIIELRARGRKNADIAQSVYPDVDTQTALNRVKALASKNKVKIEERKAALEGAKSLAQETGSKLPMDEASRMQRVDMTPNPNGGSKTAKIGDTTIDYGVSRDGQTAEIILVKTPRAKRGEGSARQAMKAFLASADENGLTVFLTADPMDKGISKTRLEQFYKSLGFRRNTGRKADFRSRAAMVRDPAQSSSSKLLAQETGGTFTPREDRSIIRLFEKRNLATLAHEGAHWYLDTLWRMGQTENPHPFVLEQLSSILEWHGKSPNWTAMFNPDGSFTQEGVDLQEAFAETFEAYLRDGKAPTVGLRSVFAAFKQWLLRAYKSIASIGGRVRLNDEIRQVFDRMVASDEAIRAAQSNLTRDSEAMAKALLEKGVITEKQFEKTKERIAAARERAEAALMARLMDEYERSQKAWWNDEERQTRREVQSEIDERKEQRAFQVLSGVGWRDTREAAIAEAEMEADAMRALAKQTGYEGDDIGEAAAWVAAANKGLPMDKASRMARAEAQGFDTKTPLYHGSNSSFSAFRASVTGAYGPGVYLGDPDVAGTFAGYNPWDEVDEADIENGNIVPVFIRGKLRELNQQEADQLAELLAGNPEAGRKMVVNLVAQGYAGVINRENSFVNVFDPANVRSVNAAFDPDSRGSADLLAHTPGSKLPMDEGARVDLDWTPGGGSKTATIGDTTIDYGVSRDGQTAEVILVKTPPAKRGEGSARRALSQFLSQADEQGLTVFLTPDPMGKGVSKSGLEAFYKSLGFRSNSGRRKDFRSRGAMVRDPAESNSSKLLAHTVNGDSDWMSAFLDTYVENPSQRSIERMARKMFSQGIPPAVRLLRWGDKTIAFDGFNYTHDDAIKLLGAPEDAERALIEHGDTLETVRWYDAGGSTLAHTVGKANSFASVRSATDEEAIAWYDANVTERQRNSETLELVFKSRDTTQAGSERKLNDVKVTVKGDESVMVDMAWRGSMWSTAGGTAADGVRIFARTILALRAYVLKNNPKAVIFTGATEDHVKLYKAMLRTMSVGEYRAYSVQTTSSRVSELNGRVQAGTFPMQRYHAVGSPYRSFVLAKPEDLTRDLKKALVSDGYLYKHRSQIADADAIYKQLTTAVELGANAGRGDTGRAGTGEADAGSIELVPIQSEPGLAHTRPGRPATTTPPTHIPPMRLNLQAVLETYGEKALAEIPPEVAAHAMQGSDVEQFVEVARNVRKSLNKKPPKSLWKFLSTARNIGSGNDKISYRGIRDDGGELVKIIGEKKAAPGLISEKEDGKNARSYTIEQAAMAAWEEGYFNGEGPPTPAEFLDALRADLDGSAKLYSRDDIALVQEIEKAGQWEAWFDQNGVDVNASVAELREKLAIVAASQGDNAISPDEAAPYFGMRDGAELLEGLKQGPLRNKLIREETKRRMIERHGDIFATGKIMEEAQAYARNEIQHRQFEIELDALAQAAGKPAASNLAKQTAIENLRSKQVREVLNYNQWLVLERRWAQKALEAAGKGDMDKAQEYARYRLINSHQYTEGRKLAEQIEKDVAYLKSFDKKDKRIKLAKAGQDYLDQMDQLLENLELKKRGPKALNERASLAAWFAQKQAEADPLRDTSGMTPEERMAAQIEEIERSEALAAMQQESQLRNYQSLTVEELSAVRDQADMIAIMARTSGKLLEENDRRSLKLAIEDIVARIISAQPNKRPPESLASFSPKETNKRGRREYMAELRTLQSLIRQVDGGENGPMAHHVLHKLNAAHGRRLARMRTEENAIVALYDKFYGKDLAKLRKDQMRFAGVEVPLSKMERISVALNMGTEINRKRLMDGYGWDASTLQAIVNSLDQRDLDFVKALWDYVNALYPEANEAHKAVHGVPLSKQPGIPMVTRFGVIEGAYWPLRYNPHQSSRADQQALQEEAKKTGSRVDARKASGFTKDRAKGRVTMPVLLDFSVVLPRHVDEVVASITTQKALLDAGRIIASRDVEAAIVERHGRIVYKQMLNALRETRNGQEIARLGAERALVRLRNGATIVGLGWNFKTALLQLGGHTNSIVRLGGPNLGAIGGLPWLLKGIYRMGVGADSMQNGLKFIASKSEYMRNRRQSQNRELADLRRKMEGGKIKGTAQTFIEQSSMFLIVRAQYYLVDAPLWMGAYEKALSGGLAETDAIASADQTVIDAQGGGELYQLAGIQRGSPLLKLFTNFLSYSITTWNLNVNRTRSTNFRNPGQAAAWALDMAILNWAPVLLTVLAANAMMPDGGDDDDSAEEIMIRQQLSFLMSQLGLFGQLGSAINEYSYSGPQGTRAFSDASKAVQAAGKDIERLINGDGMTGDVIRPLNLALGAWWHYPAGALDRFVRGADAMMKGETSDPRALVSGPPR